MDSKKKQSRYFQKLDKEDIKANFKDLKERMKLSQLPPKGSKNPTHKEAVNIGEYKIPVHADILEPNRNNPLFELLDFPSVPKLQAYINKHRQHLKKMQSYHFKSFIHSISAMPLKEQRAIINDCLSKATTQRNSKLLAGDELTEWDKAFEEAILKEQKRIEYLLEDEASKKDKRKKHKSDEQKEIAQKYLSKNRGVWKKEYNGSQKPFVVDKIIPHIINKLGISKKQCLSEGQIRQSLDWNKPK
ncbi:hypothetical protein [Gracilimonas tropica]|uniref:hypothetical protein n=1 Tax=Gracilimonas tropica TaxID=454600 RepID=UPI0003754DEF|nr:hypothetical protein [Gracilimonas tropica]